MGFQNTVGDRIIQQTIIYVAGYGRSGSTIFDTFLANQNSIFGAGELTNLFHDAACHIVCSCSRPLTECNVWGRILAGGDHSSAAHTTVTNESLFSFSQRNKPQYMKVWKRVLEGIFDSHQVIVDSSKISRKSYNRPALLAELGYQIRLVYLHKTPMQILQSLRKGSNRELAGMRQQTGRLFILRSIIGWTVSIISTCVIARKLNQPIITIQLDDFLTDPVLICRNSLDIQVQNIASLEVNHGVSGNRTRRGSETISLRTSIEKPVPETVAERLLVLYMQSVTNILKLTRTGTQASMN